MYVTHTSQFHVCHTYFLQIITRTLVTLVLDASNSVLNKSLIKMQLDATTILSSCYTVLIA